MNKHFVRCTGARSLIGNKLLNKSVAFVQQRIIHISIITQVIIEILVLSLAENSVIFRCNHLRRREDGSVENAECGMWKVRSVENFNFPFQFQFSISIPGETRRNSVLTIIKKTR